MPLLIDGEALRLQVIADKQPRQATADDGTVHMLYWDAPHVRSVLLADWPAMQAALAAAEAARTQAQADAQALRQKVVAIAQGAVGQPIDTISTPQLLALIRILIWQAGALDRDGKVRPLADWIRQ